MSDRLNFKDWYLKEIWHGIFKQTGDFPADLDKLKLSDKNAEYMAWCYQQQRIDELTKDLDEMVTLMNRIGKNEEPEDIDKLWEELGLNENKK